MSRRVRFALAVLVVVFAGMSCGKDATSPQPGVLKVHLTSPNPGLDGSIMLTVNGPAMLTSATAPAGLRVFYETFGATATKLIVTGPLPAGTVVEIGVDDVNRVSQYTAVIHQVAATNYALRSPTGYSLAVTK